MVYTYENVFQIEKNILFIKSWGWVQSELRKKIVIKKKHQSTVDNWSMKRGSRERNYHWKKLWWFIEYVIFSSTLATLKSIKYYVLYWTYFFFYHIKYILLICVSTSQNIRKCKKIVLNKKFFSKTNRNESNWNKLQQNITNSILVSKLKPLLSMLIDPA